MKKRLISKLRRSTAHKKSSFFKKLIFSIGFIVLLGLSVSSYFLFKYGVGPLAFYTVVKPSINCVSGGDCWASDTTQISNVKLTYDPKTKTTTGTYDVNDKKKEIEVKTTTSNTAGGKLTTTTTKVVDATTKVVETSRTTTDKKTDKGKTSVTEDVRVDPSGKTTTYVTQQEDNKAPVHAIRNSDGTLTTLDNATIIANTLPQPSTLTSTFPAPDCKVTCSTIGSPVCSNSYVMSGNGFKDGKMFHGEGESGDRECMLCNSSGSYENSLSCKDLVAKGAPVIMGPDTNPEVFGWSKDTKISPCFSKHNGVWTQDPFGSTFSGDDPEGTRKGKVCGENGGWVEKSGSSPAASTGDLGSQTAQQLADLKQACEAGGKKFIGNSCMSTAELGRLVHLCEEVTGKLFDLTTGKCTDSGNKSVITANAAILNQAPCKDGFSLDRSYFITCGKSGGAGTSYRFCSGGKFKADGTCDIATLNPTIPDTGTFPDRESCEKGMDKAKFNCEVIYGGVYVQKSKNAASSAPPKYQDNTNCPTGQIAKEVPGTGARLWTCETPSSPNFEIPEGLESTTINGKKVWVDPTSKKWYNGSTCVQTDSIHCASGYCNTVTNKCDNSTGNPNQTVQPVGKQAGELCGSTNADKACSSGECSWINDKLKGSDWFCMDTKTTSFDKPSGSESEVNASGKKYNDISCSSDNECASNYCAQYVLGPNVCTNNPFAPATPATPPVTVYPTGIVSQSCSDEHSITLNMNTGDKSIQSCDGYCDKKTNQCMPSYGCNNNEIIKTTYSASLGSNTAIPFVYGKNSSVQKCDAGKKEVCSQASPYEAPTCEKCTKIDSSGNPDCNNLKIIDEIPFTITTEAEYQFYIGKQCTNPPFLGSKNLFKGKITSKSQVMADSDCSLDCVYNASTKTSQIQAGSCSVKAIEHWDELKCEGNKVMRRENVSLRNSIEFSDCPHGCLNGSCLQVKDTSCSESGKINPDETKSGAYLICDGAAKKWKPWINSQVIEWEGCTTGYQQAYLELMGRSAVADLPVSQTKLKLNCEKTNYGYGGMTQSNGYGYTAEIDIACGDPTISTNEAWCIEVFTHEFAHAWQASQVNVASLSPANNESFSKVIGCQENPDVPGTYKFNINNEPLTGYGQSACEEAFAESASVYYGSSTREIYNQQGVIVTPCLMKDLRPDQYNWFKNSPDSPFQGKEFCKEN